MRFSRTDTSLLARWWQAIDRVSLLSLVALSGLGLIIALAATPATAIKRGLPTFALFERHLIVSGLALGLIVLLSLMSSQRIRRIALAFSLIGLTLLIAVLFVGPEIKGARRWLRIAGISVQPSELMKPAFVVISAFLLAEARRRRDLPLLPAAAAFLLVTIGLIAAAPDVGQSTLLALVWTGMLALSGVSMRLIGAVAAAAAGGFALAAVTFRHVQDRLAKFFASAGDTFQTDRARQSFIEGGMFGRGPGEGTIKHTLPDAHTDFIFAVVAEEYGALACLVLLGLFALVTLRLLVRAIEEQDLFKRLAVAGLALLFALQALINMGVNVGLLPAKGMTLPLISAGGSSTIGTALAMGFALALSRRVAVARAPSPLA